MQICLCLYIGIVTQQTPWGDGGCCRAEEGAGVSESQLLQSDRKGLPASLSKPLLSLLSPLLRAEQ